ncbi:MAG TPA: DotU family type IV/VI secretion system protein [Bryobacteraceae bacterium]|nr:DotU family type IV/VI secretion system protein [Bryobacteraceae bacterium]
MTRENLALLYQGLLTGIVRIRSGKQPLSNAEMFRRRTKETLAEITREAIKRGYAAEHTMETDFALIALLDEVVLSSHDPSRDAWAQRPLQEELFGLSTAGEVFFGRIEKLLRRPDSKELADMLEVFYLCILLGFEGQYATQPKTDLHLLADRVRQRIERIRGGEQRFSPNGFLPDEAVAVAPPDRVAESLKVAALAVSGAAAVIFLFASGHLFWSSAQVRDLLAKALLM